MIRRSLPVFTAFALILAATRVGATVAPRTRASSASISVPDFQLQRADPEELLRQAKDLWLVQEDFIGALAKFNAAIEADPENIDSYLQRAHFFEVLAQLVEPAGRPKFEERARADFERIITADPESMVAGVARDGLTRISGGPFIETKTTRCPEAAGTTHARAQALYGAGQYAEAAVEYERATAGCPAAADWWVALGDTYYELEEYEQAKAHFVRALSVDRWNREAHRFLSDTYVQLGDDEAAVHQLVLAVVSDPTYEAGWSALRAYATAMGYTWKRVYGDRKPAPGNADGAAWKIYAAAKSKARERGDASALAVEREAVKAALGTAPQGPFWSMLARADRAGFLDEAIFFHLLDTALASEYPTFRETKAERLRSYLETVILR
jgi:tetratricopeptide (TPR) repeat protein